MKRIPPRGLLLRPNCLYLQQVLGIAMSKHFKFFFTHQLASLKLINEVFPLLIGREGTITTIKKTEKVLY